MKPRPLAFVGPVMRKEFRQIRRDSRSLVFMIFLPAFLLVMFGFALNFDVKHIPLAVVDQDGSRASRELTEKFAATEYFDIKTRLDRTGDVDGLMAREKIRAALVIPEAFCGRPPGRAEPLGPVPRRRRERHERDDGGRLRRLHPPELLAEDHAGRLWPAAAPEA
ncbi:MAG: ABC transporter permease [Candidatus Moduliflexus flocculans]|nr:ABC transporter permease [Candidatus Moduliflexus flocculans]